MLTLRLKTGHIAQQDDDGDWQVPADVRDRFTTWWMACVRRCAQTVPPSPLAIVLEGEQRGYWSMLSPPPTIDETDESVVY